MKEFKVSFEIDVQADNPVEAVRWAWKLLSESAVYDPVGVATDEDGNQTTVDLTEAGI